MKVFISWSGELSHAMAQTLANWLPNVIQAVKPFLSSEDIQKGARWFSEIGGQLEQTNFGILCLTRSNMSAPWILFEAGALSKQLEVSRVVPLLVDLKPADLKPPLSQFNAVVSPTKNEIEKLMKGMNTTLGENRLTDQQLDKAFSREWPELEAKLKEVEQVATKEPQEAPQERSLREMIEEILDLARSLQGSQQTRLSRAARLAAQGLTLKDLYKISASDFAKEGILAKAMKIDPPDTDTSY